MDAQSLDLAWLVKQRWAPLESDPLRNSQSEAHRYDEGWARPSWSRPFPYIIILIASLYLRKLMCCLPDSSRLLTRQLSHCFRLASADRRQHRHDDCLTACRVLLPVLPNTALQSS